MRKDDKNALYDERDAHEAVRCTDGLHNTDFRAAGEHRDLNGIGNDEQGNDGEDDDDCEACHAHDHIDV